MKVSCDNREPARVKEAWRKVAYFDEMKNHWVNQLFWNQSSEKLASAADESANLINRLTSMLLILVG